MKLAPIILFVYNRPWHTQQTVEALQNNDLASESELFIYADGAKQGNDPKVAEVRKYIKTIKGFKNVTIIVRNKNWGLADNIIDGITEIVNKFGRIIVLEDDLLTSKYFLQYMNDALNMYEKETNVYGISAYSFYPDKELSETFFLPIGSSWGWATWKHAWINFEDDTQKIIAEIKNKKLIKQFDFGHYPYWNMLHSQASGKVNSWAIRFYASYFLKKGVFLHPNQSLIENIGVGEDATHTSAKIIFENKLYNTKIKVKKIKPNKNRKITKITEKKLQQDLKTNKPKTSMLKRVFRKLKRKLILILLSDEIFIKEINNKINSQKISNCLNQVTIGSNSKFYEQAEIHNLQNNKNNIIIGENTHIRGKMLIFANGGKINVGANCYIGENTYIWSAENITIGNNVLIADHIHIIDTNSHEIDYKERAESFKKMIKHGHPTEKGHVLTKPIIIEDNVWISYNVSILKGINIGKGAIIAAGSVVTKDVPKFCLVAGNPAEIIKKINND